ncbi:MAG: molecular chaperone HtpG [Bacteroidales bacterium]|nr:molecular chaperone HtpG [Bacteroidales bacterium]
MQKGKIGVTTENIFPIIKQFLYSDNEIFLREMVSNAVDATQKLKAMASLEKIKEELGDLTVKISVDKKKKTITISDSGIGMTADEVEKYINQIAFSSAEEFLEKYKGQENTIIGHFGLGFYSAFMVSDNVEIYTKSYQKDSKAIYWSCDGSPEYQMEETDKKKTRGTDIILHIDKDNEDYLEDFKIEELLKKYCRYLPVEIGFGNKKEWKDEKQIDTGEPNIINITQPLWTNKPADIKDEEYNAFYHDLYPMNEDPVFHIHLNVDYPFNLTGILYFPKIKANIELQKNKIQLYSNQVFVTDSVESIVPDFLTLLHGVIDSPDIPLNVSRSYLQSEQNVKKISSHISKKVADKLTEIFKNDRKKFEEKWNDLKLFIYYGIVTDEKFAEKVKDIILFENTDGKFFTLEEYKEIIKDNQTDKNKNLVILYATDKEKQYSYIEAAKNKGYDVIIMNGQLDIHFINHFEQKETGTRFTRVDAEVADKLIEKEEEKKVSLSQDEQDDFVQVFQAILPKDQGEFLVSFNDSGKDDLPLTITQQEFMRRMKDMSKMGGGEMNFYGTLPDTYSVVVNSESPLIAKIKKTKTEKLGEELEKLRKDIKKIEADQKKIEDKLKDKKEEEIPQADKDKKEALIKKLDETRQKKNKKLQDFAKKTPLVNEIVDLALLTQNMLKGKSLDEFVKRSVKLIK